MMKYRVIKRTYLALLAATAIVVTACGESGGESALDDSDGSVVIALTDAPGDFASYDVTVTSVSLQRRDGLQVETLPLSTSVDFAQYVELTEFLTAATVPSGVYTSASITLDYTDANIHVESGNGAIIPVTTVLDNAGEPVSTVTLAVNFENTGKLVVAPGIAAHLTLDFDLQASNTVEFTSPGNATVIVDPVLLADLVRESHKTHRARGVLQNINLSREWFSVHLYPFRHRIQDERRFGSLLVQTDDKTHFDVNAAPYSGIEGLRAMQQLPALSAVVAKGQFRRNPFRFIASQVFAGSSVPNGDLDIVRGNVLARSGNVITLKGASLERADGDVTFNDTVMLRVGEGTLVTQWASSEQAGIADISVGQRVHAFGTLENSATQQSTLDTTNGSIRLLLTRLRGSVTRLADGLELQLSAIDNRAPSAFDFSGTGVDKSNDADPDAYQIDTRTLSLDQLSPGSAVKIAGHVHGFALAPADFNAHTLVDASTLPAVLRVSWAAENEMAVDTSNGDSLLLDLGDAGRFHHVSQSGVKIDLQGLAVAPVVQFNEQTRVYVIRSNHGYEAFSDMATFIARLDTLFAEGSSVAGLLATGKFQGEGTLLSANTVSIRLR